MLITIIAHIPISGQVPTSSFGQRKPCYLSAESESLTFHNCNSASYQTSHSINIYGATIIIPRASADGTPNPIRVVYNKIIIAEKKSKYTLLYFCSPFSAGFLSQSNRSSNLHNSIITEEAMDTGAGASSVVLPVASQGFIVTARNTPSVSKSSIYLPYRENDVGPLEGSSKVIPAFAELPHAGRCVEAYQNQMHTMASVTISQKPQVFHTGNAALSAATSEASAFHGGIPGATFGGSHQMLQQVYPGMVMPVRVSYPSPGMPIAYQKPQVFPGLSNKPPHL